MRLKESMPSDKMDALNNAIDTRSASVGSYHIDAILYQEEGSRIIYTRVEISCDKEFNPEGTEFSYVGKQSYVPSSSESFERSLEKALSRVDDTITELTRTIKYDISSMNQSLTTSLKELQ